MRQSRIAEMYAEGIALRSPVRRKADTSAASDSKPAGVLYGDWLVRRANTQPQFKTLPEWLWHESMKPAFISMPCCVAHGPPVA